MHIDADMTRYFRRSNILQDVGDIQRLVYYLKVSFFFFFVIEAVQFAMNLNILNE